MTPMRKLGAYTFRHTAITDASGVAHVDTLCLFEGRSIEGSRKFYVEEIEVHKLLPVAQRLLQKSGLGDAAEAPAPPLSPAPTPAPGSSPDATLQTPPAAAPSPSGAGAA